MYRNKLILISLVFVIGFVSYGVLTSPRKTLSSVDVSTNLSIPGSCTTYALEQDGSVYMGNNEDYSNPSTYIWTTTSSATQYGGLYLGYEQGSAQGGVNEKGLAFDGLALNPEPMNVAPGKPGTGPCFTCFMQKVLGECATVDEAAEMITSYNWGVEAYHQILIADASGDAAIISVGSDGDLVVTHKAQGNGFLLATNFNVVQLSDPAFVVPCERYVTAQRELDTIIKSGEASMDSMFRVLDKVHQQGATNNTLYSNVFDLKKGLMHLAYWYQFDEIVTLNVQEEIAKGPHKVRIKTLFTEKTIDKAERAFQWHYNAPNRVRTIAGTWLVITLICGLSIFADSLRLRDVPWHIKLIWLCIGVFLGPVGVMVYLLVFKPMLKGIPRGKLLRALMSASVSTTAITLTLAMVSVITALLSSNANLGPLAIVLPYVISLFLFRGPVKAYLYRIKYGKGLAKSALTELVTTIAGVLCLIAIDTQIGRYLDQLSINATHPATAVFWLRFLVIALVILLALTVLHLIAIALKLALWPDRLGHETR